jgi:glycosyltransferase involved in cell wall biosynthesis
MSEDILFVELASKSKNYPWPDQSYDSHVICLFPDREISSLTDKEMVQTLDRVLSFYKPNTVLTVSYSNTAMRYGSYWARRNGAVSICVNESWRGDKNRWLIKEWGKGLWCRWAYDGMFVGGIRSKEYYRSLGFPEKYFWLGQNVVDNNFYSSRSNEVSIDRNIYRSKYNLPHRYFLCPTRLAPEKNLERLLKAFAKYKAENGKWDLVITGSGPQDQKLKTLTKALGLEGNVTFKGWIKTEEMPVYYGLASCVILPSVSEPWGLVVNEAMACSLPVLVSDKCGCQPDLCFRGVNGFPFNPYREEEITNAMVKISTNPEFLPRMGKCSLDIIQRFSPANYAASLRDCILTLRDERKMRSRDF